MINCIDKFIIYRNFDNGDVLEILVQALSDTDSEKVQKDVYTAANRLIELAGVYGFNGNLWQNYLTLLIVSNENVFSKTCEINGIADGSLKQLAIHDFLIFSELFRYDFKELAGICDISVLKMLLDYKRVEGSGTAYNKRIRDRICHLSKQLDESLSINEFTENIIDFYKTFGVGRFGLNKAFRLVEGEIVPISNIAHVKLDDIIGYEDAKKQLIENTEAFINGKPANNCLLYGDAGTGKSSSIKAILNQYYENGLRMIEIYKHQFKQINSVIEQIKNRNYKFILYMDDLSFEDFETDYKYLKAVIEGGLEKKPANVLIYATSNRRHLIKESFSDSDGWGGDIHKTDTVQEKLSLAARFGVSIFFTAPDKKQFQVIVKELAKRAELDDISESELMLMANRWELTHGGFSGRTARQFIDYLLGTR